MGKKGQRSCAQVREIPRNTPHPFLQERGVSMQRKIQALGPDLVVGGHGHSLLLSHHETIGKDVN